MAALFTKVQIDERVLDIAFKAYQERHQKVDQSLESRRQNIQNSLNLLQERQDRLVDSFMAGITPSEVYEQKMTTLKNERVVLQAQLSNIGKGGGEAVATFEQVKNVFLTANSIAYSFLDADDDKKREYAKTLLSNVLIKDHLIQQFQFKPTYQPIANIANKDDFEQVLACMNKFEGILWQIPDCFTPTFTPSCDLPQNDGVTSPVYPANVDLFDPRRTKSQVLLHSAQPSLKMFAQPLSLLASGLRVWCAQIPPPTPPFGAPER